MTSSSLTVVARHWCLVSVLVALTPAWADQPPMQKAAKARLDKGLKLFEAKKYDEALKELRQGYVLSNAPEFLYAMGQIERIRGNCRVALTHYQAYLDTEPASELAAAAKLQIERCEKQLRPAEPPTAEAAPAPAPKVDQPPPPTPTTSPAPVVTVATPAPEPRRWFTDGLGDGLLGGGVVLLGGGLASFLVGHAAAADAKLNLDKYVAARSLGWAQPVGIAGIVAGTAMLAGAILRYVWFEKSAPLTVSVILRADGGFFVYAGSF